MSDPEPMTSLSRFLRGRPHSALYHDFNLSGKKRSNGGRRSFLCCHRSTLWEAVLTPLDLSTASDQVMPNSRISSNTRNRPRCVIDARRLVARAIRTKQSRAAAHRRCELSRPPTRDQTAMVKSVGAERKLRKRRRDVVRAHKKSAGDEGHQRTYGKTARSGGLGFGDMRCDCIHQRRRQTIIRLEPQFLEACPDARHLVRLDAGFDHRRYERRKSRSCRALLLE